MTKEGKFGIVAWVLIGLGVGGAWLYHHYYPRPVEPPAASAPAAYGPLSTHVDDWSDCIKVVGDGNMYIKDYTVNRVWHLRGSKMTRVLPFPNPADDYVSLHGITPRGDGTAYLLNESGLWLMRDAILLPVEGIPVMKALRSELISAGNGSFYLICNGGLWLLQDTKATRVEEMPAAVAIPATKPQDRER